MLEMYFYFKHYNINDINIILIWKNKLKIYKIQK